MSGIAIALHNFPEGLATFVAAIADPSAGLAIAIAIALHNIPEVRNAMSVFQCDRVCCWQSVHIISLCDNWCRDTPQHKACLHFCCVYGG